MNRVLKGITLTLMMLGHNYVLNQPMALQSQFQKIHTISVTQFNLLYSIPSACSILLIIPIGLIYNRYSNAILLGAALSLFFGQLFVSVFGAISELYAFWLLLLGRIVENIGAQVLYMIQGNLASTWMSRMAGMIFILPQCGEIGNAFLTPILSIYKGVFTALMVGLFVCFCSFMACLMLYYHLRSLIPSKFTKIQLPYEIQMMNEENKSRQQMITIISDKQTQDKTDASLQQKSSISSDLYSLLCKNRINGLIILLCSLYECLFFPFLDNANELIQSRFCITYGNTGRFICIPFFTAILITALLGVLLKKIPRHKFILPISLLPLIGHSIIYFNGNCGQIQSLAIDCLLGLGFFMFGAGLGGYYSICFPAVGLCLPQHLRGTGYAILCFFQTISMTLIPILSGLIIEYSADTISKGYKNSSLLFVLLSSFTVIVSLILNFYLKPNSFSNDDYINLQQKSSSKN